MNELIQKLKDLLHKLDVSKEWDMNVLIDTRNKLNLYLNKFVKDKDQYRTLLNEINFNPEADFQYNDSIIKVKSLITTLIEDILLSDNDFIFYPWLVLSLPSSVGDDTDLGD